MPTEIGFIAACQQYFGKKENQTLLEFRNEVAQLTDKDRAELKPMLEEKLGIKIK